jgi:hypothetical protein
LIDGVDDEPAHALVLTDEEELNDGAEQDGDDEVADDGGGGRVGVVEADPLDPDDSHALV